MASVRNGNSCEKSNDIDNLGSIATFITIPRFDQAEGNLQRAVRVNVEGLTSFKLVLKRKLKDWFIVPQDLFIVVTPLFPFVRTLRENQATYTV